MKKQAKYLKEVSSVGFLICTLCVHNYQLNVLQQKSRSPALENSEKREFILKNTYLA